MVPVILLGAAAGGAVSAAVGAWYLSLTKPEREKADRKAAELAMEMFEKKVHDLTGIEAEKLGNRLRGYFGN